MSSGMGAPAALPKGAGQACTEIKAPRNPYTSPIHSPPAVSEEEQKEEVERSVLSTLSRLSHQPHPERSASAGSAGAAPPVDEPVPFVPITLVCKDIRWVGGGWRWGGGELLLPQLLPLLPAPITRVSHLGSPC